MRTSTRARIHIFIGHVTRAHAHICKDTSTQSDAHAQANHRQWSRDAYKHTRTHSLTFIGHVMLPHARITHIQWSRDAHAHTHRQANAQEHELSQSSVVRCTQ